MAAARARLAFRLHLAVLFTVTVTSTEPARGQSTDSLHSLGEITVTAVRTGVSPARAAQRVTILEEVDIRSAAAGSVADILSWRSGVFIRRQGEGLATMSQRGGGPSQTQMLIDGMRLSDPQLGQFDLSLLPTHLFHSIEILHGPGSALYGTDGMSGIVHLRSRPGDEEQLTLATELGAYGHRVVSGGWEFDGGAVTGIVSAEFQRADGDFPFYDATQFPPRESRRSNADREMRSLFGRLSGRAGAHRLRGAVLYVDSKQGIPGLVGSAPQNERRWDEQARFWVEDSVPVGHGLMLLRGFAHRGLLRYRNDALEIDQTGRTWTGGVEAEVQSSIGSYVDLSTGAVAGFGSAEHPSLSAAASDIHGALYGGATINLESVRLYPALRGDAYRQGGVDRMAVSPGLGLNARLLDRPAVYAKAGASSGFRVPTFNDRFWRPGGNPHLKPERARSLDGGLFLDGSAAELEVTAFAARFEDKIVWTDESGRYWAARNISQSLSRGLEASARIRPIHGLSGGLFYAYTRAVDRSDPSMPSYGRQLRYVPLHLGKAYVCARFGSFGVDLNGQYIGARYVTGDESERLAAALVAAARLSVIRPAGPFRARLSLVLENALDTSYAVVQGHPMPPRHARLRLVLETR